MLEELENSIEVIIKTKSEDKQMEMDTLEEMARKRELKEENKTHTKEEVKKMFEELGEMELLVNGKKYVAPKPKKINFQKAVNPKHTVPFGNGSQEEQDKMEHLLKTNPALYAAITSWN